MDDGGTQNYYAYVCDHKHVCDMADGTDFGTPGTPYGTFTVYEPPDECGTALDQVVQGLPDDTQCSEVIYPGAAVSEYTKAGTQWDGSCDLREVDPINIGFYGPGAQWNRAADLTQEVTTRQGDDWTYAGSGKQTLVVDGNCRENETDHASAGARNDRFHIRFFDAGAHGKKKFTLGDAHWEDYLEDCGPANIDWHSVPEDRGHGSGFDLGRRRLRNAFIDDGYYTRKEDWGNTKPLKQCDDDEDERWTWPASNGTIWWIYLP